jgi:hypothetical protein
MPEEQDFSEIAIPENLKAVVRSPVKSVFYLPTTQLTILQQRLHSMANRANGKLSCRNFYAFSPKNTRAIVQLLRVEIIQQADPEAPLIERRKHREWSDEHVR